ncbi:MAG TPA: PhzF family phenazine biosynthesis protein [Kiritimatiellia bacterium]|nr:PhzF family phenazine biosynthesis protein [Kiritimatiellia bacterium]
MKIPMWQVDAFATETFAGNPAAVCLLDDWLDDRTLQAIAAENNLSETAFLVPRGGEFDLRWFAPTKEVALCGHATLAAAKVLFDLRGWKEATIRFRTRQRGVLTMVKNGEWFEMDFPALPSRPVETPAGLSAALGAEPRQVLESTDDWLAVLDDEAAVRELKPDFAALKAFPCRCLVPMARGDRADFVSRAFAPRYGIPEDPVTGSAHCALAPYWAGVLGKDDLQAFQVSARGGEVRCRVAGDRVKLAGQAVVYLEGTIDV